MTHPLDIKYIGEMLPNISQDILDKQKVLQPGTCVGFGGAFKIPMIVKMEMPNPMPYSSNCDVSGCWKMNGNENVEVKSNLNSGVVNNFNNEEVLNIEVGDNTTSNIEHFI